MNIIIFFVSSDDFKHLIWGWKTANMHYSRNIYLFIYIYVCVCVCVCVKKYINLNSQTKVKGLKQ